MGYSRRYEQHSRFTSARLKIQAPTQTLLNEILEALLDAFPDRCLAGPILRSTPEGFHTFLNIEGEKPR